MNDVPPTPHEPGEHCGCGQSGPDSVRMIYIGNLPDMDVDESDTSPEQAFAVTGGRTFGSADSPLYRDMTNVTLHDDNGDGRIYHNNTPDAENISYSMDGQETVTQVDTSFIVYGAQVTLLNPDGTTETQGVTLRMMQDAEGNTFLMPPPRDAEAWEYGGLLSKPIVSITFPTTDKGYSPCEDSIITDPDCFPCFARGTLIETEFGPLPVEMLVEGVQVLTRDNGLVAIRWIGSRKLGPHALQTSPELKPIRISAGALGEDSPRVDLLVSPQHRILVRSRIAQKIFGSDEVLVAAKQLLQLDGIDIAHDCVEVEYFHILFDQHEIVWSNGAETESLYTGTEALRTLGRAAREEIFTIFPELREQSQDDVPAGARVLASGRLGRKLAVRHLQNNKALVQ